MSLCMTCRYWQATVGNQCESCAIGSERPMPSPLDAAVIAAATDPLRTLQAECVAWHTAKFPRKTPFDVMAKLTEEVGEIARALVGESELRAGRGNVCDEAAQAVLVLATLVGRFYQRDLLADALAELRRHQAALAPPVPVRKTWTVTTETRKPQRGDDYLDGGRFFTAYRPWTDEDVVPVDVVVSVEEQT